MLKVDVDDELVEDFPAEHQRQRMPHLCSNSLQVGNSCRDVLQREAAEPDAQVGADLDGRALGTGHGQFTRCLDAQPLREPAVEHRDSGTAIEQHLRRLAIEDGRYEDLVALEKLEIDPSGATLAVRETPETDRRRA